MNEEIDELNSSLRDIRLENEEEIEFLRSKVVSKAPVKSWFDFYRVMHENLSLTFLCVTFSANLSFTLISFFSKF